jgi:hypothetical protein
MVTAVGIRVKQPTLYAYYTFFPLGGGQYSNALVLSCFHFLISNIFSLLSNQSESVLQVFLVSSWLNELLSLVFKLTGVALCAIISFIYIPRKF